MRGPSKYLQVALAAIMPACASGTAKVPQEGVRVANPDSATTVVPGIGAPAPVNEKTANTAKRASAAEPRRPRATLPVTPSGPASVSLRGATLSVQPGSVEKELTLSITALDPVDLAKLPQGMVNVTRDAAGFRFLPHGKHFTKRDARISLPVDTLLIPRGYTLKDVLVYFYDEERGRWAPLPRDTTSQDRLLARALTPHFTDMVAGVLQEPETPATRGLVPTAVTGIKAADPASGVISIQAPQTAQSGAATLRYPIVTPAGRNGMQPDLALTYSSEGRSGWCGHGWSLRVPSIEVDTRWGVPRFDARYETEIYLVNGGQTTLQPHRSPESMERITDRELHPRTENAFSKIVRHGGSPKDYWWEVTAKDGVVHESKRATHCKTPSEYGGPHSMGPSR